MINQTYLDYSQAIKEQLDEQGFVLLSDILTQQPNYEDTTTRIQQPASACYEQLSTPKKLLEALSEYAKKISIETSDSHTRRFFAGDFTLQDYEEPYEGYEIIYMHAPEWQDMYRGEVTYTPEDSQPIIVPITHNALAIIKRSADMRSFVKRVTHHAKEQSFTLTTLSSR